MTEDTNSPNSPLDLLVSAFSEHDCLCCGPFEGDFGSPDDRILKDKMVTSIVRKWEERNGYSV
jgi:hypothetical protein